jgi:hypothetical protein
MRLKRFYRQLEKVRKVAKSINVDNDGAIRIKFTTGEWSPLWHHMTYCPLTAATYVKSNKSISMGLFERAALNLGIKAESMEISRAADLNEQHLSIRERQIRRAMFRALGLLDKGYKL